MLNRLLNVLRAGLQIACKLFGLPLVRPLGAELLVHLVPIALHGPEVFLPGRAFLVNLLGRTCLNRIQQRPLRYGVVVDFLTHLIARRLLAKDLLRQLVLPSIPVN